MTVDIATLKTRLAEAETAYHEVATGTKARVYVDQNGERVEYNVTNLDKLRGYISTLQASIAQGGTNGLFARPSGPARFLF